MKLIAQRGILLVMSCRLVYVALSVWIDWVFLVFAGSSCDFYGFLVPLCLLSFVCHFFFGFFLLDGILLVKRVWCFIGLFYLIKLFQRFFPTICVGYSNKFGWESQLDMWWPIFSKKEYKIFLISIKFNYKIYHFTFKQTAFASYKLFPRAKQSLFIYWEHLCV